MSEVLQTITEMPKNRTIIVSIIVPVYKSEIFLEKCLNSIKAQTYNNWEAILVDDGSPDNCGAICDEYAAKDNRFRVIHQKNRGVVNARNTAIAVAQGEFLAFVDSDDYIEPDMLEEMVSHARTEELDIVWCDLREVHCEYSTEETLELSSNNNINISNLLKNVIPGYLWNKIVRKEFWDKCNIKTDEHAVICEDTYISLQLLANNPKNGVIHKPFYNYIKTNSGAATDERKGSIVARAEKNIVHMYEFLCDNNMLGTFHNEFTALALKLKINLLRCNVGRAIELFPFAHRRLANFKFPLLTSLYYWIGFNSKLFGKLLFKLRFR